MTTKKVIYVEGPDCAGKSTLINALKREGDYIIHNGRFPSQEEAYVEYLRQLNEFSKSNYDRLILDRGVLSEVIYGMVMRQTTPDEHSFRLIIKQLDELDYDFVVCLPPFGRAVMHWAKRQDDEYINQFEQYVLIYDLYSKIEKEFSDIVYIHDYTRNNQEIIDALS